MNVAVVFTVLLLALMVGAGFVSASWGYALGRQALMGVRQPDSRPTSAANGGSQPTSGNRQGVTFRSEQEILEEMRTRTLGGTTPTMIMPTPLAPTPAASTIASPAPDASPDPATEGTANPNGLESSPPL